jgi:uncharacterized membrane protein
MKDSKLLAHTALVGVFALAMTAAAGQAIAGDKKDMEKCYGVVKAGKNDCKTSTSACAGTAEVDGKPTAFIALPKGTCEKIVGASLEPKA